MVFLVGVGPRVVVGEMRDAEAEEVEEDIRARSPSPFAAALPSRGHQDLADLQCRLLGAHAEESEAFGDLSGTQSSAQLSAALTDLALTTSHGEASSSHGDCAGGLGDMVRAVREQQGNESGQGGGVSGQVAELHAGGFAPLAIALASGRVRFPLQTRTEPDADDDRDDDDPLARPIRRGAVRTLGEVLGPSQRSGTAPPGALEVNFSTGGGDRQHLSALEVPSMSRSRSGSSDFSAGSNSPSPRSDERHGTRRGRSLGRSVAPSRRGVPPPCPGVSKWRKPPSPEQGVITDLGLELQRPGGNWRGRHTPGSAPAILLASEGLPGQPAAL